MIQPGSAAFSMKPAEDDQVRRQRDIQRQQMENAAARSMEATSVGEGGFTVIGGFINITNGGTFLCDGAATFNGSLSVPAGSLNTAGSITAGASLNANSLAIIAGATIGGNLGVGGTVTAGGVSTAGAVAGDTGQFDGGLYSLDARNFVVVSSYAACWIDINGHFGISPSSMRFKTGIITWVPTEERLRLLLTLRGVLFHYIWEEENGTRQLGWLAEEMIEAGWPEFIFYDSDGEVQGINYDRVSVALLELNKWQQRQIDDINARLAAAGI